MRDVVAVAVGAGVAALIMPLAAAAARGTGVVDRPGALKVHERPVPYLGGVGVLAAVAGPVAVGRPSLMLPLGFAALLGLADDVADLSPALRLGVEAGVGLTVAAVVPTGLGLWAAAATVLGTVALINAVNLVDGLDGLAAGTAGGGLAGLAFLLDGGPRTLALAAAGACLGFLLHNRPPARIYLGDCGSYLLGTTLAILVAAAWREGRPAAVGIGALAAVAVPGVELSTTFLRRARAHESVFAGDRSHAYDRLRSLGWPVGRIALVFAAAQGGVAALGWLGGQGSTAAALAATGGGWLAVIAATVVIARRAGRQPAGPLRPG